MSFYRSDKLLRDWAESSLHRYLDPREYPALFAALRTPRRTQRLKRVEMGLLKLMLDRFRPERSAKENQRYAESNAVKVSECADALNCDASTVRRAKERINKLVCEGARQNSAARRHGLLLFHDLGIYFHATFWDAIRSREYSERQADSQIETHGKNIALSDERRHDVKLKDDHVAAFARLSPSEQARLLEEAGLH
jgi:hypothetical protein